MNEVAPNGSNACMGLRDPLGHVRGTPIEMATPIAVVDFSERSLAFYKADR